LKVVLDTHIWVWWLLADPALPARQRKALNNLAAERGICLPAICMWEAQMLHSKGRIELPIPFPAWLRQATSPQMLTVLPLGAEAVIAMNELPVNVQGDPADRMIVATARIHELPLATHDAAIRKSRLVRIWRP
jgi:PIN domain nuclease of toxin-antitoxin system